MNLSLIFGAKKKKKKKKGGGGATNYKSHHTTEIGKSNLPHCKGHTTEIGLINISCGCVFVDRWKPSTVFLIAQLKVHAG